MPQCSSTFFRATKHCGFPWRYGCSRSNQDDHEAIRACEGFLCDWLDWDMDRNYWCMRHLIELLPRRNGRYWYNNTCVHSRLQTRLSPMMSKFGLFVDVVGLNDLRGFVSQPRTIFFEQVTQSLLMVSLPVERGLGMSSQVLSSPRLVCETAESFSLTIGKMLASACEVHD